MKDRKIIQILRVLSTFRLFKRFAGPPPKLAGWGDSLLVNDEDFCKFLVFYLLVFKTFTLRFNKSDAK